MGEKRAANVRELMADALDYVGSDWFFDFKVPALFRAIADFYDHSTDPHDEQIQAEARAAIRARVSAEATPKGVSDTSLHATPTEPSPPYDVAERGDRGQLA